MSLDLLSREFARADHRISYGPGESQFGDLWMPADTGPGKLLPTVVFFHGGWWQNTYDLGYGGHSCAALKAAGFAVWSLEYRRVGGGGGWPNTFHDAAAGFDYLSVLAKIYPLDLSRVAAVGHSAGGHLAFWLAGRPHIEAGSPVHDPQPKIVLRGLIALAGAVDLRLVIDLSGYFSFAHDRQDVYSLMGGKPRIYEDRYRAGNPGDLLPLGVRQMLLQGTADRQIPAELPARWAANAKQKGDEVTIRLIPDADHFDLVDPLNKAWPSVLEAVRGMFL